MEAFTSTQHLKQQGVVLDNAGASEVQLTRGQNVRVTNWSPVTIMFRYQIVDWSPMLEVDWGVYFIHIHDARTDTSVSDNASLGLNAKG